MKASASPLRTVATEGTARAEIVALLADALVARLLPGPGCHGAQSGPVKRRKFAEKPNGCAGKGVSA